MEASQLERVPLANLRLKKEGRSLLWLQSQPLVWVATTYFAEGLPYSIVHQVVGQQYFTSAGFSAQLVGLASLLHAPWLVKFLWSPLVERRASTKRWMIGAQLALALVCLVLAGLVSVGAPLPFLLAALIAAAFLAATNDIAIDGYYLRTLETAKQSSFSGVRISSYRVAMLVGSGPLVALAGIYGFGLALVVLAGILTLLAVVHAFLLVRDSAQATDASKGGVQPAEPTVAPTSGEAARAFLAQPLALTCIVLLLTYRAGDALLFAMNAKFLGSLGLDTTLRGVVNGTFGTAASIAGSILGGVVLARFSFRKLFVPITVLQSTAILLYHALAHAGAHVSNAPSLTIAGLTVPSLYLISATVVLEQFVAGMGTAAFTSFILKLCHGRFKTMHFAFASSVMSVAAMGLGASSGYLYESLGAGRFFFVAFLATLPGVVASLAVRLK